MADKAHSSKDTVIQDSVLDLAGDGFLVVGEGGDVILANAAAAHIFRCRIDEIVGYPAERLFVSFPPAFFEASADDSRYEEGRPPVRHAQGRCADATTFPVEVSAQRVRAREGNRLVLCLRGPRWMESTPNSSAVGIGGFGYWSQDLVRNVVSLSVETRAILGLSKDCIDIDARTLLDYVHPDDRTEFDGAVARSFATGERLDVTHRIRATDGTSRFVRNIGEVRLGPDGTPLEVLGVTFDVTDRDRAVDALRENEDTLSAIVNSTTAMIYIKDTEGKYLLVNTHFEEVFGVRNHELRGKTDYEYMPRDRADSVRVNDARVLEAGKPVEFEETVPHDGEDHIYISIKFPLRRPSGEVYAVCGISTDITERKRIEAELEIAKRSLERLVEERTAALRETNRRLQEEIVEREEAASQLQRLIDTAGEGIWMIDKAGCTTFANPRMGAILGYETGEMIGRSIFRFMSKARRHEAKARLERRRNGLSEDHDFEFRRKDGSGVWTLLSTSPVYDKNGEVIGALAMVTDISERKHAEEYQALLLQELDHRVKNTLAMVTALSDLTMERTKSVEGFAEAFGGRIQAMARTHEALAIAKWQGVSCGEVVTVILAPFQTGDPSRIFTRGDSSQLPSRAITPLALTLNELATNALKYGALSDGHGTVRVEWERSGEDRFSLTWRETGGVQTTRAPIEGTGLKLIRGLIEYELGGILTWEFQPDGIVCRIEIPAIERG